MESGSLLGVAAVALIAGLYLCLMAYIHDRSLVAAYTFRRGPRWEIGAAFQPGRWGLCVMVSVYRSDRGVALYVGPFYLYALLGAYQ